MTAEQIAVHYADRSGFHLADFVEVGLPIYRLTLAAYTMAPKRVSPIHEFVLRSIDAGLGRPEEISAFLSLPSDYVHDVLTALFVSELVTLTPAAGELVQRLSVTRAGQLVLSKARLVTPEERTYIVKYDALLRAVTEIPDEELLSTHQVKALGIRAFPGLWNRPVQIADLHIPDVQKLVRLTGGGKEIGRRLLAIRSIERRQRQYRSAIALIYRSDSGDDVQVSFAVDGKLAKEYEVAFMRANGVRSLRMGQDMARMRSEAERLTGKYLSEIGAVPTRRVNQSVPTETTATPNLDPAGSRLLPVSLRIAADVQQYGMATIYVQDHPALLQDALQNTRRRMLIISPWITDVVVDEQFIRNVEILVRRGVDVYIGYGFPDDAPVKRNTTAIRTLRQLSARYPQLRLVELGDTHAKLLLRDTDFVVVTSFNWLSFRGNPDRAFRDEQGTLVAIPQLVERVFQEQMQRFI